MTVLDQVLTKVWRLPRITCGYTIERDLPVSLRDGVTLLADHYVPKTSEPRGTVLVRSPYGRASVFGLQYGRTLASRGYHVIMQSCRGTFGSGGEISAFTGEAEDGADTVAWLRKQPWFQGTFAMVGTSYLGFNAWAVLTEPPPELVAAVIVSGPYDAGRLIYGTGAMSLETTLNFLNAMAHQGEKNLAQTIIDEARNGKKRLAGACEALPLAEVTERLVPGRTPWLDEWLLEPDLAGPYWEAHRLAEALQRTDVPVLLFSGWQDFILDQTLEAYVALRDRGVDVALTLGDWSHADLSVKAMGPLMNETFEWLGEFLAKDGKRSRTAPVRAFVAGGDWRELPSWPPAAAERTFHLQPGGGLAETPPEDSAQPSQFTYDPLDPTPSVGGLSNSLAAGNRDNQAREQRSDVLTFTTAPLTQPLEVVGTPVLELAHSSDNPHADLFVRVCAVNGKGVSTNVSEASHRLSKTEAAAGVVTLSMSPLARRFNAGTQIRVQVSGGAYPLYSRNPGTGEPDAAATTTRPSHRTIAHGAGGQSVLRLPVSD